MSKKIVVDSSLHQIRIAVLDDGDLIEIFIEKKFCETIVGNIYRGKVKNVLPGMQAVFVDIGQSKNGFMSLTDKKNNNSVKITEGMEIIVQVEKDASGSKGAKLNNEISITGRFIVLLPNQDYIGISQKIISSFERKRLKDIANRLKPENYGIIIRTNAEGKSEDDFISEINKLYTKSEKILNTGKYMKAPVLIYKDSSILYRAVRDLVSYDIDEFIINDIKEYNNVLDISSELSSDFNNKVKYFDKDMPIFDYYCIETQINHMLQKHVWLKSGGFIVIEQTEACVVIDVNTGKFIGRKNLQETIFKTNKEAAIEIAKQIKLRNLSGMIIIDFIDMKLNKNQNEILQILKDETKKDRIKTVVIGITELGLVQVTRKKAREPLSRILLNRCPCCNGTGITPSITLITQRLFHDIENIFSNTIFNQLTIHANKQLIDEFDGVKKENIYNIEKKYNVKIIFICEDIEIEKYYIEKKKAEL